MIRKIVCASRSCVRLVNQIFGILTRRLYSGNYQIFKYLHFGNLYLQLRYVTVHFWVYHKTYYLICTYLSTINNLPSISLLFEPFWCTDSNTPWYLLEFLWIILQYHIRWSFLWQKQVMVLEAVVNCFYIDLCLKCDMDPTLKCISR